MKLSNKQYILFDLDGTLIDSKRGIFSAIYYTFERLGLHEDDESVLNSFIGPSIGASFRRQYGFSDLQANEAVEIYREYYSEKGVHEYTLYDGIEDLLIKLKAAGKTLGVATKKPDNYAKLIIEELGFNQYFDIVCGSTLTETHDSKAHIIKGCAEQLGASSFQEVVMIGDTKYDCSGSNEAGVDCIGVLYGYGCEYELKEHGATAIAKDMTALTALLV